MCGGNRRGLGRLFDFKETQQWLGVNGGPTCRGSPAADHGSVGAEVHVRGGVDVGEIGAYLQGDWASFGMLQCLQRGVRDVP